MQGKKLEEGVEPPRPCSCSSGEGWAVLHPIQQQWDVEERAFSSLQVSTACRVGSFWMHGAAEGVGIPAVPVHLPELLASQGKPDFAELSTTKNEQFLCVCLPMDPLSPHSLLQPLSNAQGHFQTQQVSFPRLDLEP